MDEQINQTKPLSGSQYSTWQIIVFFVLL